MLFVHLHTEILGFWELIHVVCTSIFCRTGDSRGFAFVRYKYEDEAQKAVDRLDGGFLSSMRI